jgi:group I intron endonuclease
VDLILASMANGNGGVRIVDGASIKRPYTFHAHLPSPFPVKGSGIYSIINRNNLKIYIGSGVRLNHRWTEHRHDLAKRGHHSRYFQRAFDKDPSAFEIYLIEEMPNAQKDALIEREQFWMEFYKSYLPENGYNISPRADSCQGIKRDPEYVARVSAALKGKKFSKERLEIHRNRKRPTKFRSFTAEQKAEQSRRFTGRNVSKEWCSNISKALIANPYQKRAVLQFSLDGQFIRQFDQIQHAENLFGGRTNIHSACSGKRRQACGYVWRYSDESKSTDVIPIRSKLKPGQKKRNLDGQ